MIEIHVSTEKTKQGLKLAALHLQHSCHLLNSPQSCGWGLVCKYSVFIVLFSSYNTPRVCLLGISKGIALWRGENDKVDLCVEG